MMLHAALLLGLPLGAPAPSPALLPSGMPLEPVTAPADDAPPEPPAEAVREMAARASAAQALGAAVRPSDPGAEDIGELARVVVQGALQLDEASEIRRSLLGAAEEALAFADARPKAAALLLELTIADAVRDLAFVPIMEAPLPVGFPWPAQAGEIRLLEYPEYRLARSEMRGGQNNAFFTLFRHIQQKDIAMTAPVEMTMEGDEMVDMAFLYRRPTQGTAGEDGRVLVEDIEPMRVVSMGVRSTTRGSAIAGALVSLEAWIERNEGWERAGRPRVMGYNGPSVPRSRQFIEVQIPVRKVEREL